MLKIINTLNYAPGEPLTNYGDLHKLRTDSNGLELPELKKTKLSKSFVNTFDAYIDNEEFEIVYNTDNKTAKIIHKARGAVGTIRHK